jgi:hypothetical protein
MQIVLTEERLEVHLALWQKILGLMRDFSLARSEISEVEVVAEPMPEAMSSGIKFGLRLPWLYYAARTVRLDQLFVVRRGVPALGLWVDNGTALKRVLLSTGEAEQLAARLQSR